MTFRGKLKDGVVVPDEPINLPDGTEMSIQPVSTGVASDIHPTLAEQFGAIIGIVPDLPADMAEQHDHYIHGTPRQ